MGRFRNALPDYGDPRRDALAQALIYGGGALAQGAGTQGFGALAEAVPAASYGFGQGMQQGLRRQEAERERERRTEVREREDTRWERTMEEWERADSEAKRKRAEVEAGRVAEQERKEEMLERIREAEGDQAAKRASLLSPANLEKTYARVTGEPEPASAPTTRNFPDGSLRQWDAGSSSWKVLQREPAGQGEAEKGLTPGQLRNEAQEIANREVGTWRDYQASRLQEIRSRFPEQEGKIGQDLKDQVSIGQLRKGYKREFDASFGRAMAELGAKKTSRAPAAEARPAAPPPQAGGQGRFEQLAGQVQQQLEERGAPAAAREKVQAVVEAVQASVPPEVRDSEEFIQMLQQEIASGKDPAQIAREIRQAFGGR